MQSAGAARVRDRDHHVDIDLAPAALEFIGQEFPHVQTCFIYRDTVKDRIRTGQIHILENAWIEAGIVAALPAVQIAVKIDEHRFTGRDIAQEFEAQGIQRHAFRCNQIFRAECCFVDADHQRADTVGIAECQ